MPTPLQAKGLTAPKRATPARVVKLADEGIVVAIVAVTGVVDAVNDLIVPGAFAASLKIRNPKVVDDHEWQRKVGRTLHVEEWMPGDSRLPKRTKEGRPWPKEAGALVATMQYNLATQRGRDSFAEVKFYAESNEAEFSIGYKVPDGKARKRSDGVRVILAVNLFEFSHVLFGAAPLSMVMSFKSMHAGSAGTSTQAALGTVEETDEDFPDDAPKPAVDPTKPWDDAEEKRARADFECKTALGAVLEAKAAQAEPVTPATDQEIKAMSSMKGSYQERTNLVEVAARDLFEATYDDPCVCVVATYDTEVVVRLYIKDGTEPAFVLPYSIADEGVELGEPTPVELSLVAELADAPADVEQVAVVQPVYDAAAFAQSVINTFEASPSQERKDAAASMRTHLADLFGVSVKAADPDNESDEDPVEEAGETPAEESAEPEAPAADTPAVPDVASEDTITRETLPEGDWAKFRKTAPIEAVRMEGPFSVETREGVVSCTDGWLAIDSDGYPYPIDVEEFSAVYAPEAANATADAPATPEAPAATPDAPADPSADDGPSQEALDAAIDTENATKSADDTAAPPEPTPADPAPDATADDARVSLNPDEHFDTLAALDEKAA